jgi:hypothetical protein
MLKSLLTSTVLCLALGNAARAQQQEQVVAVLVQHIAGSNLYLDVGTDKGLSADDTLLVYAEGDGTYLGALVVLSATHERAVVTFAGAPFPVTRGKILRAVFTPAERFVEEPEASTAAAPGRRTPTEGLRVSGRLTLDVNTLQTTSGGGQVDQEPIDRYFTTPTARLRATVAHMPGDLTFRTNLRVSTRYSSEGRVQPTESYRVYEANLEKAFQVIPVRLQLGRFYNRYETYSGYWDGMLMRIGPEAFGIGGVAGFQPERSNELFSTDVGKYTGFLNLRLRGRAASYSSDLSIHHLRPRSGQPNHTFGGWSQRLQVGRFHLRNSIQVDRIGQTDRWEVTQLLARSSIPLGRRMDLRLRYTMHHPQTVLPLLQLLRARRDQGSVGVSFLVGQGSVSLDATANRVQGTEREETSFTYTGAFTFPRTFLLGLGFNSSVNYWTQNGASALYVSGGVSRAFGRIFWRASYQRYQTKYQVTLLTHSGDFALTIPLTRRLYSTLQARIRRGKNLSSNNLYATVWMNF